MFSGIANLMMSIFRIFSTDTLAILIIILTILCWVISKKFWTFPGALISYLLLTGFFWVIGKVLPDPLEFLLVIVVIGLCIWAWIKH